MRSLIAFPMLLAVLAVTLMMPGTSCQAVRVSTPSSGTQAQALKQQVEAQVKKMKLGDKIKHIIVLMEENRSYDHLMGWYPRGNGLNGTEYNLLNASDPHSKKEYVNADAPYVNICDPNHGVPATTYKLFGPNWEHTNRTAHPPPMDGFAMFERTHDHHSKEFCGVIDMFNTTAKLPVLSALADEYLFFDRLFAAVPGPTWPNRQFFMSATSAGLTETFPWFENKIGKLYPQKTIFDQVTEAGAEWKLYYQDGVWELFMKTIADNPEHLHSLDQFYADCASGDLPSFAFINPRGGINITTGEGSNDDHPDHDVALAEAHYKNVYEALRASPAWNETLFVLTFDEHGGFYDHVPPPLGPSPDNYPSFPDTWFKFDRLGIRVPTLLISPWIKKGQIVSEPPQSQKPTPTSEYDLTSIIASSRKILTVLNNTPALTHRDAWVATWEHVLDELQEPRTDCPMRLPDPPAPSIPPHTEAAQPLNELQNHMLEVHSGLLGEAFPSHIKKQGQVGDWLQAKFQQHKIKTAAWKASKDTHLYDVVLVPRQQTVGNGYHDYWGHLKNDKSKMTISRKYGKADPVDLCLDMAHALKKLGNELRECICHPSSDPKQNRDDHQQWTYHADATLRPYHNSTLCVTNQYFLSNQTKATLFLEPCNGEVEQHYKFDGGKGWNYGNSVTKWMLKDRA